MVAEVIVKDTCKAVGGQQPRRNMVRLFGFRQHQEVVASLPVLKIDSNGQSETLMASMIGAGENQMTIGKNMFCEHVDLWVLVKIDDGYLGW